MDKDDYTAQPLSPGMTPDAARPGHAQALVRGWSHLSRQLVPLIGDNGFGALFGRTVRLIAPSCPWLTVQGGRNTTMALLERLEIDLAGVDAQAAAFAHQELMNAFTRQLGGLIGAGLTARLLAETTPADEPQQNQQEHK